MGQFPYTSSRGNKYLLILYEYDSNAILAHPIKTRQAHEIKHAWIILHTQLLYANRAPSVYIMDNEKSHELKNAIVKYKLRYQLTPPNIHRINAAERAIRTFKNHFIAGLATIDPDFPIREWDCLLPQAETTLISSVHPALIRNFLYMLSFPETSISRVQPWHLLEPKLWSMIKQPNALPGPTMEPLLFMSALPWNTTAA